MRLRQLLVFLLACVLPAVQAAILAIDYGAEFTKLSLVKPGVPFDVLIDRDSSRKISSVVAWKREDRVFGAEGKSSATRFPQTTFPYVKPLLAPEELPDMRIYPQPPTVNDDGSIIFPHPKVPKHVSPKHASDKEVWTPTDLLAHQLAYYRGLADDMARPETVTQAVVTVPAWWTQAQRRAYRDALELQGLSCLAMIGEGTGVALNYAMSRTFPDYDPETGVGEKEYHVVFDSGAFTTSATVLALYQTSYRPSPKSTTLINTTHIDTLAVGWEDVGGVHLDLAVLEMITDDFVKKSGLEAARKDSRAMAKLQKEAVRVKHILSANQESIVAIESVYNDVDFRSMLTRAALESRFQDVKRFTRPVSDALAAAGITLNDLTSVLLFGGNTRVPIVQNALRDLLGDKESLIAQGVNTDEAAVLGAAFYAAGLSRQFKMKSIEVAERIFADITLDNGDVVYPAGSVFGERKTLLLKPEDQMHLEFAQNGSKMLGVDLVNVKEALGNFTAPSPVVNMTLRLDSRGIFSVANAALVSNATADEKADAGVAGAIKGLFGKKETEDDKETEEADDDKAANDTKAAPVKPKKERIPIKFRESAIGFKPLTGEQKRVANQRLSSIAAFEAARVAREEARNLLEGYLYRLQNLLSEDTENRALHEYATDEERTRLGDLVKESFDWLHDHADDAKVEALLGKRTALEVIEAPIIKRFTEYRARGKAVEDFAKAMYASRAFLVEAAKNRTAALEAAAAAPPEKPVAPPKFTQEELDTVRDMIKESEAWMDGLMEKQAPLDADKTKDPLIFVKDIDERGKKLQFHVQRLEKKRQPRAPRPPKPEEKKEEAEAETSTTETTQAKESTSTTAAKEEETGVPKHEEL